MRRKRFNLFTLAAAVSLATVQCGCVAPVPVLRDLAGSGTLWLPELWPQERPVAEALREHERLEGGGCRYLYFSPFDGRHRAYWYYDEPGWNRYHYNVVEFAPDGTQLRNSGGGIVE